jgi:hypothetical protein
MANIFESSEKSTTTEDGSRPLETQFFRDEAGDLIIQQRQPDGDVVEVIVPTINLATFLEDVLVVCGIAFQMQGHPADAWPGEPCPNGSIVGKFVTGVASLPMLEMEPSGPDLRFAPPPDLPRPRDRTGAERQRRWRENRKRDRERNSILAHEMRTADPHRPAAR